MSKRNAAIFTTFLVIALVSLYFVFNSEKKITNYPSGGRDIIAFGDSLVEGVGASSADHNFVSLLSEKIGRPIINLGVSGNTTEDGVNRLSDLNGYNPKVVLILLGGNDRLKRVPLETTVSNLEKIIENIQARGAVVVLLGVRGNLLSDRFDSTFEELHNKYDTAYVPDVLDGIFGNAKLMTDSLHPNDLGYQMIADKIYPVLLEVI